MECLRINLEKSLQIIRKYNDLINAYVLDFYVYDHWKKLPASWQEYLETLEPEHLAELLNTNSNNSGTFGRVWPLELLSLKQLLQQLCISRKLGTFIKDTLPCSALVEHPKLKHIFTKCVKPKKRHEIQQMAAICKRSCVESTTSIDFIVDFGAGLGHLARVLGYGFGIRVCCLEMQRELNDQARVIDLQFENIASKHLSSAEIAPFQRPIHVTLCLTADMQPEKFIATIEEALHLPEKNFQFGIIGLHPCGDLGAILMRMFLHCKNAKFLNFVGCCYMKLSTAHVLPRHAYLTDYGYPLSEYLRQQLNFSSLSYEAREISCHAIEMYCDRLSSGNYEYLKVHSFRAVTERILTKHWPEQKHCGLRSVKHMPGMHFEDYFYKAVQDLPAASLPLAELQTSIINTDLLHWKRIVIFYTLRLMFAPLVESIILYDRILFLKENHCDVQINAIFDPRLSPRNHITRAVKRS